MREVTHRLDEHGILRQCVSAARLRRILDADGDDYDRPASFARDDEWFVEEAA